MKYVYTSISHFFETIRYAFEIAGMMRAAAELRRMGENKESDMIFQRIREMNAIK
jgi:hypothetical protein